MPKLFEDATNKQGLIVSGGEASSDFGMVVAQAPSFDKPSRKMTTYTVPGRNGAVLFQQDAYNDVTRSYQVWIAEAITEDSGGSIVSGTLPERVAAITEWLFSKNGYTRLEDSFEPDYFRLAYYKGGDNFTDELLQVGQATLKFTCRPERFYKSAETPIVVTNGDSMYNPTKFKSKPLIHIETASEQTVTVSINGHTITAEVDDYINIDCERMNAYRQAGENKNTDISGEFPTIDPGANGIVITGTVSKVTITPRYFTV